MKIFNSDQKKIFETLVRDCGKYMLTAHSLQVGSDKVKAKSGDADFVTVYDETVQARLIEGILQIFPDAKFFAEEKENSTDDVKTGLCFIIDPIDGTTNFIHNLGASTISIALLIDGEPVFGLVYDPYRDDLFVAEKGNGAFLNGESINVSSRELDVSVVAFGTTPYRKKEYCEKGFGIARNIFMNCADIRRSGSAALDMAYVACGKLDAFFECLLSPWDYAAGYVLVKEAGGIVTEFDGAPAGFSKPAPVLCSNGIIHNKLCALINKV